MAKFFSSIFRMFLGRKESPEQRRHRLATAEALEATLAIQKRLINTTPLPPPPELPKRTPPTKARFGK